MLELLATKAISRHDFVLYCVLKRTAGDEGHCTKSTTTLVTECGMSAGQVAKSKRALEEAGLIRIEEKKRSGARPYHEITIRDVWLANMQRFAPPQDRDERCSPGEEPCSRSEQHRSRGEQHRSPCEQHRSPGERKKNSFKKNQDEEEDARERARAADAAPPPPRQKPAGHRDPHFEALAEICGLQTKRLSKGNRAQLGKHSASLREDGIGPEFILACGEAWFTEKFDWKPRGDVSPPTPSQAAEWIGQKWKATETKRRARKVLNGQACAYLMPDGRRLKPVTSLLYLPEFEGVEPGEPSTYPPAYLEAARELGVPCG